MPLWLTPLFPLGSQSVHDSASFRFMVSHLTPAWPQSPVYLRMTWNSESSGARLPSAEITGWHRDASGSLSSYRTGSVSRFLFPLKCLLPVL